MFQSVKEENRGDISLTKKWTCAELNVPKLHISRFSVDFHVSRHKLEAGHAIIVFIHKIVVII